MAAIVLINCIWDKKEAIKLHREIILDPAHDRGEPGIVGHFGIKECAINANIAKMIAKRLTDACYLVHVTYKKDSQTEEKPVLLLNIHTNNINTKTKVFCNKIGINLAEKLKHRLDSFPQAGSYQAEVISSHFEITDYPFVLIDIGGLNSPELGLVLCPFDRTFWVLAISERIKDYLEEV